MPRKNNSSSHLSAICLLIVGIFAIVWTASAADSWLAHVPDSYRTRVNPYAGQADAIAAGGRLFSDHCAPCHQSDALGKGKRPSLRSTHIQHATDGELFWVLRNGILAHGMPSWSMLPEPSRWQIIAYVKSLGPVGPSDAAVAATPRSTVR
jgi:mono/diheme cytochrome c family protein